MRRVAFLLVVLCLSAVACGGSGGWELPAGKTPSYCNLSRDFGKNFQPTSATDYKAEFQQLDSMVGQLQDAAPAEIKADVTTLIGAVRQFEDSVRSHNYAVNPSFLAPFSDPKVTGASGRIADYDTRVCGLTTTTT